MPVEDHELITKATSGDQIALQLLLVPMSEDLNRYALRKLPATLRDTVDADDIVQQTFVEVFRSIERFRLDTGESFRGWVHGICANVIREAIKRQQRVKRGGQFQRIRRATVADDSAAAALVELLSAGSHSPSRSVMGHEAVQAVKDAMEALPTDYRQAVQLHLIDGQSLDQTARAMNRSPRAVQGLLDRARKKMRDALERLSKYG